MKDKLISANSLLATISSEERWNVPDFVYDSINRALEIKAIPIVWLEKYRDSRINRYGPLFEEFDTMLKHWEEENEISRLRQETE
ncbi:MAG: hypothetical protein IJH65_03955 [Methanobrevibacter sp.]|nr:hypothetical protein [Methanobrevibacter sp.]